MSGKKQPKGVSWFLSIAMAKYSDRSSSREKEFILATVQAYKSVTRTGTLSRWSHHTPGSETGRAAFRLAPSGRPCPGNCVGSNSDRSSCIICIIKTISCKHVHRSISQVILGSVKLILTLSKPGEKCLLQLVLQGATVLRSKTSKAAAGCIASTVRK